MLFNVFMIWISINIFVYVLVRLFSPVKIEKVLYEGDRNEYNFFTYHFVSVDKKTGQISVFNTLFFFPFTLMFFIHNLIYNPSNIKWKRER